MFITDLLAWLSSASEVHIELDVKEDDSRTSSLGGVMNLNILTHYSLYRPISPFLEVGFETFFVSHT